MTSSATTQLLAILIGALTGAALFLAVIALYGLPAKRPAQGQAGSTGSAATCSARAAPSPS